jgi:hypothetical protein
VDLGVDWEIGFDEMPRARVVPEIDNLLMAPRKISNRAVHAHVKSPIDPTQLICFRLLRSPATLKLRLNESVPLTVQIGPRLRTGWDGLEGR